MAGPAELMMLIDSVAAGERETAIRMLSAHPSLALDRLLREQERFVPECGAQLYAGDTALHLAAFAYDTSLVTHAVSCGADVRARNRRGAEPLHAAVRGGPGSTQWDPVAQVSVINALVVAGADPNAEAMGGVTPLHRAVRNRCSAAVEALLSHGADPRRKNDKGSAAAQLAQWTTGRGGTGSPEAKAEQQAILRLLCIVTEQ
jgi:hypothetical protein